MSISHTPIIWKGNVEDFLTETMWGFMKEDDIGKIELNKEYDYVHKDFREVDRIDMHGKGDIVYYKLRIGAKYGL